jgi:hypothetical protein
MGFTIVMQDEKGVQIGTSMVDDNDGALFELIERAEKGASRLRVLGLLDPYGDTILNALQQDAALGDLDELDRVLRPRRREIELMLCGS